RASRFSARAISSAKSARAGSCAVASDASNKASRRRAMASLAAKATRAARGREGPRRRCWSHLRLPPVYVFLLQPGDVDTVDVAERRLDSRQVVSLHGSDHLEEVRKALLAERAVAQELHQRCGLDVESFPHRFAAECDLLPEQVVLHEELLERHQG